MTTTLPLATPAAQLGRPGPACTGPASPGRARLGLICALLIASLVSWRQNDFYTGGADPVVVAKALLAAAALVFAASALGPDHRPRPTGVRTLWFLGAYLALSTLGGWASGQAVASAVLTVRVLLVAAVVWLLLEVFPIGEIVAALLTSMAAIALVGAVTGAGTIAATGRLAGRYPGLSSNEIAFLVGAPAIALLWRIVEGRGRGRDAVLLLGLVGITWLTGSRTGLVMLAVGMVVVVAQASRLPVPAFIGVVAAVPVLGYLVLSTGLVSGYLDRGGTHNIDTLNSRAIAWSAAIHRHTDFWQHWFGGGLSLKMIPVTGQFWTTQILDSSWISALVQAGVLGLALLGAWVVAVFVATFRCPRPYRLLWTGLLVYIVGRSVLESGLLDATPTFVLFLLISIMSERQSRSTEISALGE